MKSFNLPADARLKLTKTTPRKEIHGDDHVQAISLRLRWETTNEHLALLHANLKDMLFYRTEAVDAQALIAGVPDITPNLRVPDVTLPLKIELDFSGYTLTIEHGIDESSALELYTCALDKFAVDAKEGGSVHIDWSLSSNKEITPELVGILCSLEGDEIIATLTPPAAATGEAIDGSVEAFERDHPSDNRDAGDLFAEAHGSDEADPVYDNAVKIVIAHKRASISLVQRHLQIGYNRAARLLERMEKEGVVSPMTADGSRSLLTTAVPA